MASSSSSSSSSSKANISYHVRSSSFPSTSHPTTLNVESHLQKFQTSSSPSAETICNCLSSLEDLYQAVHELLNLSQTQQALSHHQKLVDELLDGSVMLLDICGSVKDLVSQIKENVSDLQSAQRRRNGASRIESSIIKYTSFQKKMKKDAKRLISSLKQMENKLASSALLNVDHHVLAVIKVLREVSAVGISTFQSILSFVSVPVSKPKSSKWSLVSKMINKAETTCENLLENTEGFEGRIDDIENGLEEVFRGMVRTRATLLNTISSC